MKYILLLMMVLGLCFSSQAQTQQPAVEDLLILKKFEDTLALCGFIVVNDSLPDNRYVACKKLIKTLVQGLKVKNSFNYPFERLKSVSIQYPQDSSFRIFTWQLYVDTSDYRYYGAIQLNSPDLKLIPLIDRSYEIESPQSEILTPEKWYGNLCYNLRQFDTPEGRKYLVFGFDGHSFFHKRKLIDVLTIKDGRASFGAPVFYEIRPKTGEQVVRNRVFKEYSSEASFRMNYDPIFDMIIFDHLEMMGGPQGPVFVPDGTHEGYKLQDGHWIWVENVFTQTMDEAPIPEPVLDSRKSQDIFGKEKKGKG
jgi:hypothetical protein